MVHCPTFHENIQALINCSQFSFVCKCWFHMNACIVFSLECAAALLCHALIVGHKNTAPKPEVYFICDRQFLVKAQASGASWPDNQHTYTKITTSQCCAKSPTERYIIMKLWTGVRYKQFSKLLSWLDGWDKINNRTVLSNPSCKGSK